MPLQIGIQLWMDPYRMHHPTGMPMKWCPLLHRHHPLSSHLPWPPLSHRVVLLSVFSLHPPRLGLKGEKSDSLHRRSSWRPHHCHKGSPPWMLEQITMLRHPSWMIPRMMHHLHHHQMAMRRLPPVNCCHPPPPYHQALVNCWPTHPYALVNCHFWSLQMSPHRSYLRPNRPLHLFLQVLLHPLNCQLNRDLQPLLQHCDSQQGLGVHRSNIATILSCEQRQ